VAVLGAFAEKYAIRFPLLADEGSVAIRRLGLLNEHVAEHHAFYGVPMRDDVYGVPYPGSFILDAQGVVVERRFEDSYRVRETAVGLLESAFGGTSERHGAEARATGQPYPDVETGVQVRSYLDSPTYRMMQRLRLTVDLRIEPGLHVYGEPVPDGYTPLAVEVTPLDGLEIGAPEAPAPSPFSVAGLDEQFFVYEGTVRVSVPLTFTVATEDQTVEVVVRYQACSATDCRPPDALQFRLPVTKLAHVERPT
jgi:hypothetical protein